MEELGVPDYACMQLHHDIGPVAEVRMSRSSHEVEVLILHPNFDIEHFWIAVEKLPGLSADIDEALKRYRVELRVEELQSGAA